VKDLDRAVEELGRLLDEDRVPPRVFDELGMNRQELRRFVDRYNQQRAERSLQQASPEAPPPAEEGRIMDAAGPAADNMAVRDASPTEPERDSLRSRFEGAADRLSPRYREVVNRYYEALSEER
jgi:DNA-directed RNA polymerase specialized sigma24 family protein